MGTLSETFSSDDLDMLILCLLKIRSEGLTTDKNTQAGINKKSGNVWVWSEDWQGCVYCNKDDEVNWSYSCSTCGAEYDFDSEAECCEYADKHADTENGTPCCEVCFERGEI